MLLHTQHTYWHIAAVKAFVAWEAVVAGSFIYRAPDHLYRLRRIAFGRFVFAFRFSSLLFISLKSLKYMPATMFVRH